jgi:hypothetical protein
VRSALAFVMTFGIGLAACGPDPTRFHGAATFPNGPSGCRARCSADGLEMSGFVYSGEFATSCVCRPLSAPPVAPFAPAGAAGSSGATNPQDDTVPPSSTVGEGSDGAAPLGPLSAEAAAAAGVDAQSQAAAAAAASARSQQLLLQHRKP